MKDCRCSYQPVQERISWIKDASLQTCQTLVLLESVGLLQIYDGLLEEAFVRERGIFCLRFEQPPFEGPLRKQ